MIRSAALFALLNTFFLSQTQVQIVNASVDVTRVRICRVADIQVQQNFELDQYKGIWYDVENVRRRGLPQKQLSNYTLDGDHGLYMLSDGISVNGKCVPEKILAHGRLVDPSKREGKFRIQIEDVGVDEIKATSNDYWVIHTDYTSHAVVYSCQLYLPDGTCSYNHTSVWLMSRSPALEPAARARIVRLLADLCVPEERILKTSRSCIEDNHEYANEDDIVTTNGHDMTEYEECILTNVTLQADVDFQRYMGMWYEIAKKRTTEEYEVPDSTTTILRMIDNNTIAMQLDLFRVFNQCMDVTVNGVATTNGAQWTVTFDPVGDGESRTAPYWIIETDYDNYALVYGCKTHEDGTCSHRENTVYVMGRKAALPQIYMDRVNELLSLLCIEPDDIILTKPEDCRRFPVGTEKCLVDEFPTVKDFEILKLHGEWFQIGRQVEIDGASFPSMRTISFLPVHPDDDSDIRLIIKGVKLSGVCVEQDIAAHGYSIKSRAGVLTIFFPRWMADHGISNEVKYQVVYMDYKNIVVMYGCRVLNEDGSCQLSKENFLVLSRTKNPTVTSSDQILEIASSLCIDSSQIVFDQDTCAEIKDGILGIGNSVGVGSSFTHVPQSLPSLHVTPRKCNPEREVYGCCTLIDAPAVGPNNEGCPSIHEIQPASNSVSKQAKCWKELQTATEDGATTYLTCNDDGTYTEVQCDASLGACWCVDRQTGQSKPGSVTTIMEQPNCSLTNCQRHQKRIDDYLSRIDMRARYFYRPNCEEGGTYAPTQCFDSWRYCWCVDAETGKKVPGTLAQGTLPVCSDKFEALTNSFGI